MSKKANKTIIGAFVVGATALLVIGILTFGSGLFLKRTGKYVLFFDSSVKGLSVGAPVIFRGVNVGTVKDISLVYDGKTRAVLIPVVIEVDLSRVKGAPQTSGYSDYKLLIEHGLQARLEIQSFFTGQLMIAFDLYPDKPSKLRGIMKEYPELPTLPVSAGISKILEEIPFKEISENLNETVIGINKLINSQDLQENLVELRSTLKEVTQAARTFRLFAEYLEQHPEALLRGKAASKGE